MLFNSASKEQGKQANCNNDNVEAEGGTSWERVCIRSIYRHRLYCMHFKWIYENFDYIRISFKIISIAHTCTILSSYNQPTLTFPTNFIVFSLALLFEILRILHYHCYCYGYMTMAILYALFLSALRFTLSST